MSDFWFSAPALAGLVVGLLGHRLVDFIARRKMTTRLDEIDRFFSEKERLQQHFATGQAGEGSPQDTLASQLFAWGADGAVDDRSTGQLHRRSESFDSEGVTTSLEAEEPRG